MIERANPPTKLPPKDYDIPTFKNMGEAFKKLRIKNYIQKKYPYYLSNREGIWTYFYKGNQRTLDFKRPDPLERLKLKL